MRTEANPCCVGSSETNDASTRNPGTLGFGSSVEADSSRTVAFGIEHSLSGLK